MARDTYKGVRFGFVTDTHFSATRNGYRTDDYLESVTGKFSRCYEHFAKMGCEFVLHGGDVFDKPKSQSKQMLLGIRKTIIDAPFNTYYIWGQHDLTGYNRDTGVGSDLHFLTEICDGKLNCIEDHKDICGVHVFASHVFDDPAERLASINPNLRNPVVCVCHALINPKGGMGTVNPRSFGKNGADIVLSGDLHGGFDSERIDGTLYCNPGSLARTSREDRKPAAYVIAINRFMSEWTVDLDRFEPECEDFPFPEEKEEAATPEAFNSDTYIEAFERFKVSSKDIFDRLRLVGEEHGIGKDVIDFIMSHRK